MNNNTPTLIGMLGKRRHIRCLGSFDVIYNQLQSYTIWLVDNLWISGVRLVDNLWITCG